MPITPVPILGTQGYATDPVTKFSMLMSHVFLSDYNQTQLYPGKITSVARILQQSGNDPSLIKQNLKQGLQDYFSRYYSQATVTVSLLDNDPANALLVVQIDISVFDEGQSYSQTWQFNATNNVISQVLQLNNTGV